MRTSSILVFTTTYNEAHNIGTLIDQIASFLPTADLLVLDDNSPDGTWDIIQSKSAEYPQLRSVKRPGKLGIGSAHKYALVYAIREGYQTLITMDADHVLEEQGTRGVRRVGILGSTSLVAQSLLSDPDPIDRYVPFSRASSPDKSDKIPDWISLIPIWALLESHSLIEARGGERIVVLSSTSIFTKTNSSDANERHMVERFIEAEGSVVRWAGRRSIRCTILRPTMIYGRGLDRNVSQIARLIRRFGFFPLLGPATGLRQPIHVDDVASACRRALDAAQSPAYNLSGGEPIAYKEMVRRIFRAMGREPRFFTTPLWLFRAVAPGMRLLPKFHDWSPAMAERMNQDLVFDNSEAQSELGMTFRRFEPTMKDLFPDPDGATAVASEFVPPIA